MNNNLKEALKMMLYFSDEQVFEEFDKINFKKEGWYKNYHWNEKQEEKYLDWLSDFLKKNWEGISEHKPTNKKMRDKVADEFIGNYGCVTRELNQDDFTNVVCRAQLDEVMSKREREAFNKWMFGQTTPLYGVYRWDLNTWLNHKPNLD